MFTIACDLPSKFVFIRIAFVLWSYTARVANGFCATPSRAIVQALKSKDYPVVGEEANAVLHHFYKLIFEDKSNGILSSVFFWSLL